eukprot:10283749-Ditylum_brightwellii.AAC.1
MKTQLNDWIVWHSFLSQLCAHRHVISKPLGKWYTVSYRSTHLWYSQSTYCSYHQNKEQEWLAYAPRLVEHSRLGTTFYLKGPTHLPLSLEQAMVMLVSNNMVIFEESNPSPPPNQLASAVHPWAHELDTCCYNLDCAPFGTLMLM